jgi:hypothetical protein
VSRGARPSASVRTFTAATYAACALFAFSAAAHLFLYFARPTAPDIAAGFTEPQTWQIIGPAKVIYLREVEARALDAVLVAATFALVVALLGVVRLRPRKPRSGSPGSDQKM